MREWIAGLLVLGLLAPAAADSKDKEALRLAPSSPWNVHFADDSCRLSRSFGEGKQRIIFTAVRFDDGDEMRVRFAGESLKAKGDGKLRLQFQPSDMWRMADYYPATIANNLPALLLTGSLRLYDTVDEAAVRKRATDTGNHNYRSPAVTPSQEEAITHIELSGRSLPHVILETGSLGKVMEKLRECTDQLLTEWGIDAQRHKNLSARTQPVTSPGRWLTSDDYPMHLVMRGVRGIVHFRLMVDEEGKPTGCHIQQSTRPAEFDEVVCKAIMRKAKFNPARDADGQALPSYYNNMVHFSL